MQIERTRSFQRDFKMLSRELQQRAEKAVRLLLESMRHPSLEARLVDRKRRIWKAKINGGYRITFQVEQEILVLRRVGAHAEMERPEHW